MSASKTTQEKNKNISKINLGFEPKYLSIYDPNFEQYTLNYIFTNYQELTQSNFDNHKKYLKSLLNSNNQ